MIQAPATRDAPAFEALYALVRGQPGSGRRRYSGWIGSCRSSGACRTSMTPMSAARSTWAISASTPMPPRSPPWTRPTAAVPTSRCGASIRPPLPSSNSASIFLLEAFGIDPESGAGHFTACGTEANHTAMIVALTDRLSHRNPRCRAYDPALCTDESGREVAYEYWRHGCLPLSVRPALYVSPQTHVSIEKNARNLIGTASIRTVPVDRDLRMDVGALADIMAADEASEAFLPFLVIGSVGATPSGIVDPLAEIGEICRRHGAWFHVDAPVGRHRRVLAALARRLPRRPRCCGFAHLRPAQDTGAARRGGCGMFLCRHREAVERAFNVTGPGRGAAGVRLSLAPGLGAPTAGSGCSRQFSSRRRLPRGSSKRPRSAIRCAAFCAKRGGKSSIGPRCRSSARFTRRCGAGSFTAEDAVGHLRKEGRARLGGGAQARRARGRPPRHHQSQDDRGVGSLRRGAALGLRRGGGVSSVPGASRVGRARSPRTRKAGATVQPTSVQSPSEQALCQAPTGTVTWGHAPSSIPRRWLVMSTPSSESSSLSTAPA